MTHTHTHTHIYAQRGMTALLLACSEGHEDTAKMLVPPTFAAGSLNVCSTARTGLLGDHAGYSALLWAEDRGLSSVVEMLCASGAERVSLPALVLFCGEKASVQFDAMEQTVAICGNQATLRSTQRCPLGAKGYFELEILEYDSQYPHYGFVSAAFERMLGASYKKVGDDVCSWAVDGENQYTKHNDERGEYTCKWKLGDVVGLACDLESMHLHVSVNGCFDAPNGLLFTLSPDGVRDGLFAAFTGSTGKLHYNLGESPFKHVAPSADYKGFVEFGDYVTLENSIWLHAASRIGDIARVALMIQSGENVNTGDQVTYMNIYIGIHIHIYICICIFYKNVYIYIYIHMNIFIIIQRYT